MRFPAASDRRLRMKASAHAPASTPKANAEPVPTINRVFCLQSTLTAYEVEELSGWQLATILSEAGRVAGGGDGPAEGPSGN
jgi:hypothetical protein